MRDPELCRGLLQLLFPDREIAEVRLHDSLLGRAEESDVERKTKTPCLWVMKLIQLWRIRTFLLMRSPELRVFQKMKSLPCFSQRPRNRSNRTLMSGGSSVRLIKQCKQSADDLFQRSSAFFGIIFARCGVFERGKDVALKWLNYQLLPCSQGF